MTVALMTVALTRATTADLDRVVALQRAAYARNRVLLGVEPLPLIVDYAQIFATMEVWLALSPRGLDGVLILEPRAADLLIWSIATDPAAQSAGLGRDMLAAAEARARVLGRPTMRLYTGAILTHLVDWYGRHGYVPERQEVMPDRVVQHMIKQLQA